MTLELPKSRLAAASTGHRQFFTGKPCSRGHVTTRYTATGNCIECAKTYAKKYTLKVQAAAARAAPSLVTVDIHPDDHGALYDYADALNYARGRPLVVRPVARQTDTRTPWEISYDLHMRTKAVHHIAVRMADAAHPRTHSDGWQPSGGPIDERAQAILAAAHAPKDIGGGRPDYLP